MAIRFTLLEGGPAGPRLGRLQTRHNAFATPAFMPVGTLATVKSVSPAELLQVGADIILANTYHLYLRPGPEVIAAAGGLHGFMRWDGSILTDSGGFQVFSLSGLRDLDDDGVTFRSHIDGSSHRFTPEKVIAVEEALGADIIMPLDDCPPYPAERGRIEAAVERTARWLERAVAAKRRDDQALFGIVQGGVLADLRAESARAVTAVDLPGYAVGGLSVGESFEDMLAALAATTPLLPSDRPRYLMGVGTPDYIVEAVARGIDLFDCVLPTRMARNGTVFVPEGRLVLRHARYADDLAPLDPLCDCPACAGGFSRAYLRHLIRSREVLGLRLTTLHNLRFMSRFMQDLRASIAQGRFEAFRRDVLARHRGGRAGEEAPHGAGYSNPDRKGR
ncbi:MAG TPA: tRNA guanosine(34) transglycosylase Tgt [Bacillota bacterium]